MRAFSYLHPRDQIVEIMQRIYAHEMTTTSGGNISVRDETGDMWITPARLDKGSLRREHIVRISPKGEREGLYPPSSEYPFHMSVYEARPDLHAVIHAHPGVRLSASAYAGKYRTHIYFPRPGTCAANPPLPLTRFLGASNWGRALLNNMVPRRVQIASC
jgi:L-fuculose-phosphate aldolase